MSDHVSSRFTHRTGLAAAHRLGLAACVGLIWVCGIPIGCGKTPQTVKPSLRFPTTLDTAPPEPPDTTAAVNTVPNPYASIPSHLFVHRLAFQLGDPKIEVALAALEEVDLPESQRELWRRNGLRLSRLDRDQLPLMLANLPTALRRDMTTLQTREHYAPIRLIDRVRAILNVRVTESDGATQDHRLARGRLQMQMRVLAPLEDPTGPPLMDLLPHHYGLSASLLPRDPEDHGLDGTTFDSLQIQHPMAAEDVWLVWADPPAINQSDQQPMALGRAMLAAQRGNMPLQTVLIIMFAQ
ncbi:MAG: hypothetical protein CMJ49_10335 [Planctomycetaceae bacterium]|nr:hypothetical protein [Planctomycetaceae bacterium]